MKNYTYNLITYKETPSEISIFENILNQKLITIKRLDFNQISSSTFYNLLCFISDMEEIGYRLNNLTNALINKSISSLQFCIKKHQLYNEIDAKFNHYFNYTDATKAIQLIEEIATSSREGDYAYLYFCKNSFKYITKKANQQIFFNKLGGKTFEESLNNYITKAC